MANVFAAAHFYDGDPRWLKRAYDELLRMGAVCEADDQFHQCAWSFTRQGGRFLMMYGFEPMTGACEWATRGGMPQDLLRHVTEGKTALDPDIAFRVWWKEGNTYAYEAINLGDRKISWQIEDWNSGKMLAHVSVPPHGTICGEIQI